MMQRPIANATSRVLQANKRQVNRGLRAFSRDSKSVPATIEEVVNSVVPPYLLDVQGKVLEEAKTIKNYKYKAPLEGANGLLSTFETNSRLISKAIFKDSGTFLGIWDPRPRDIFPFATNLLKRVKGPHLRILSEVLNDSDVADEYQEFERDLLEAVSALFGVEFKADDVSDGFQAKILTDLFNAVPDNVDLNKLNRIPVESPQQILKVAKALSWEIIDDTTEIFNEECLEHVEEALTQSLRHMYEVYLFALLTFKRLGMTAEDLSDINDEFKVIMKGNKSCFEINNRSKALSEIETTFDEEVTLVKLYNRIQIAASKVVTKKYAKYLSPELIDTLESKNMLDLSVLLSSQGDKAFNLINAIETLDQEIGQGDNSNILLGIAERTLRVHLEDQSILCPFIAPVRLTDFVYSRFDHVEGFRMDGFIRDPEDRYSFREVETINDMLYQRKSLLSKLTASAKRCRRYVEESGTFSMLGLREDCSTKEFVMALLSEVDKGYYESLRRETFNSVCGVMSVYRDLKNHERVISYFLANGNVITKAQSDLDDTFYRMDSVIELVKQWHLEGKLGTKSEDGLFFHLGSVKFSVGFLDDYTTVFMETHGLYKLKRGFLASADSYTNGTFVKVDSAAETKRVY